MRENRLQTLLVHVSHGKVRLATFTANYPSFKQMLKLKKKKSWSKITAMQYDKNDNAVPHNIINCRSKAALSFSFYVHVYTRVCVCAHPRERERERESVRMCECVWKGEGGGGGMCVHMS